MPRRTLRPFKSRSIEGFVTSAPLASRRSVIRLPVCDWIAFSASVKRIPWAWIVTFEAVRAAFSDSSAIAVRTLSSLAFTAGSFTLAASGSRGRAFAPRPARAFSAASRDVSSVDASFSTSWSTRSLSAGSGPCPNASMGMRTSQPSRRTAFIFRPPQRKNPRVGRSLRKNSG